MNFHILCRRLEPLYGEREAQAIVFMLLEDGYGMSRTDVLCGALETLSDRQCSSVEADMKRLESAEPVQYVTGKAYFCGRKMKVCRGVLIPRPETEELCRWVVQSVKESAVTTSFPETFSILDVGTGSGCIAVTLSLDLPHTHVSAWDISPAALQIAAGNAKSLGADVAFSQQDILHPSVKSDCWDVIVSNPPYVLQNESSSMEPNVLKYEPREALFVPDDDPLRFYRAIVDYAENCLRTGGTLYFEINPMVVEGVMTLFVDDLWKESVVRKDQYGRQRMVKATKR